MAILRENDPRIGCLAAPISAVAGFILFALGSAAAGAGADTSTVLGLCGAVLAVAISVLVVRE